MGVPRPNTASLAVTLLLCATAVLGDKHQDTFRNFTGHKLIRVLPLHDAHVKLLHQLPIGDSDQVDFWRHPSRPGSPVDVRLPPEGASDALQWIRSAGMKHEVLSDNVQHLIDQQRVRRSVDESVPQTFNLTIYHTYEEISAWIDHVVRECGAPCTAIVIGQSYENRSLKVIKIQLGPADAPAVWIDAGIHAREWIAPASALHLINQLISSIPAGDQRPDPQQFTWYILPVANPDGYHYTWTNDRMWRKTRSVHPHSDVCRGADPNRNWNFFWTGIGTSSNPCEYNFRGVRPFSEPETAAMSRFLWRLRPRLAVYVSLHSYGQYWLTPWGYTYDVPRDYFEMYMMGRAATRAIRRRFGSYYHLGSSARLLYPAAGGSDDWAKGVLGVKYSYTVELRDRGRHGFLLPADKIAETGAEITHGLKVLTQGVMQERRRRSRVAT